MLENGDAERLKRFGYFLDKCRAITGWDNEQIKSSLRMRFGGYNETKEPEITAWLHEQVAKEGVELANDAIKEQHLEPQLCPYHDAPTIGDHSWRRRGSGEYVKIPAWRCATGGRSCFLKATADHIRKMQGLEPVNWNKQNTVIVGG